LNLRVHRFGHGREARNDDFGIGPVAGDANDQRFKPIRSVRGVHIVEKVITRAGEELRRVEDRTKNRRHDGIDVVDHITAVPFVIWIGQGRRAIGRQCAKEIRRVSGGKEQ
jgi:hypothetical protein